MTRADVLCALLRAGGGLALRGTALRLGRGRGWRILAYHRVLDVPDDYPFDRGVVSCGRVEFEREMTFVRRHFQTVGFTDLERDLPSVRNPLTITFDDGYKDNREWALPVLLKLGLKATFFVTTGCIGTGQIPWWDEVVYRVGRFPGQSLELAACPGETFALDGPAARQRAAARLLELAKRWPDDRRLALLAELRARTEGPSPELCRGLMMDWDDVGALVRAGMEIGSHTVTHPILGNVADAGHLRQELADSKRELEARTGRPVAALSYPVGRGSSVTEAVVGQVVEAGYRYACVYEHGLNPRRGFDPYRLRRIKAEVGADFDRFRAKVLFPEWIRY